MWYRGVGRSAAGSTKRRRGNETKTCLGVHHEGIKRREKTANSSILYSQRWENDPGTEAANMRRSIVRRVWSVKQGVVEEK